MNSVLLCIVGANASKFTPKPSHKNNDELRTKVPVLRDCVETKCDKQGGN